jgi:hypothetical protein
MSYGSSTTGSSTMWSAMATRSSVSSSGASASHVVMASLTGRPNLCTTVAPPARWPTMPALRGARPGATTDTCSGSCGAKGDARGNFHSRAPVSWLKNCPGRSSGAYSRQWARWARNSSASRALANEPSPCTPTASAPGATRTPRNGRSRSRPRRRPGETPAAMASPTVNGSLRNSEGSSSCRVIGPACRTCRVIRSNCPHRGRLLREWSPSALRSGRMAQFVTTRGGEGPHPPGEASAQPRYP